MKKCILFALAALTVVATGLADENKPKRRGPPRRSIKPSGGIIEKQQATKVFRILNTTSCLPVEKLNKLTVEIRYSALLPIEVAQGTKTEECPFATAEKLVAQKGVAAGVVIVEDEKLPITLFSPDRRWAIFNVAPLKADKPGDEKFFQRFTKVYWCVVARSLGAGNSSYPGCVLVPYTNVHEIDAIKVDRPCPEPFNKMIETGNALGMKTLSIATYRTACKQGWAPDPTNEVQKAIWNEIHTLPSEPIKIKPETKKVD